MSKPIVLILTDWYVPGYKAGGPIRSVYNLVSLLKAELEFRIITSDRDLMEEKPYEDVPIDEWTEVEGVDVIYASEENASILIKKELQKAAFDHVYLNSFFSRKFTIEPILVLRKLRLLDRVVLAPRGMLGEGALKIKRSKKRLFLATFGLLGLQKLIHFHSTDASESSSIRRAIGSDVRLTEIPNIPSVVEDHKKPEVDRGELVFLSRVSPKKNLDWLITRLNGIDTELKLSVYGQVDDQAYYQQCKKSDHRNMVDFKGVIPASQVRQAFDASAFFVLPTHNENFGHAIIEALSYGCPVIISDQTPWNDLDAHGAGWVISLDEPDQWRKRIESCLSMSDEEYQQHSFRAKEYVKRKFDLGDLKSRYLTLFRGED